MQAGCRQKRERGQTSQALNQSSFILVTKTLYVLRLKETHPYMSGDPLLEKYFPIQSESLRARDSSLSLQKPSSL